jgi:glycerol-3-phosphate cytidylyltransferase
MSVLTMGTFDIPHIGHQLFLRKAERYVAHQWELIIGVNSDDFVAEFKERPPLYRAEERMAAIRSLGYSNVVLNDGPGYQLVHDYMPRAIIVGSDWLGRDYLQQIGMTQEQMREWKVDIIFVPYSDLVSTSDIKRRVRNEI